MRFNSKRGSIVTLIALCLSLMFPVIQFTVIDFGMLHIVKEKLKFDLTASSASVVTCVDWDDTYMGEFTFDIDNCETALYQCLRNNIAPEFADESAGFQMLGTIDGVNCYRGTIGNVTYYAEIYNGFGVVELGGDRIPDDVAVNPMLVARADKPAVFIVARYDYKPNLLRAVTGSGNIALVQYASAELRSSDYEVN